MGLFIIVALLGLTSYLIYEYYTRRKLLSLRGELGLDGPPADIWGGNLKYLIDYVRKNGLEATPRMSLELREQYGDTLGLYLGGSLSVMTTNPEHIREVFITQFSNFSNRQYITLNGMYPFGDSLLQVGVEGGSHGVGWKEIRSVVSAIFTSGKMKKMHRLFHDQIDDFLDCLLEKCKESDGLVDIYGEYQALTMDVIARCAFGLHDISCIRDRDNTFYTCARFLFSNLCFEKSPFLIMAVLFPPIGVFRRFSAWGRAERQLADGLSAVVRQREEDRARGKNREMPDMIDLVLQENEKRAESGEKPMHHDVIVSNCYAFLIAGYETTSTALSYATWLLAANGDCQQRLFDEVTEIFGEDGDIDYDRVMKLSYMNAVMLETLRLKPPIVTFTARTCIKDTTLGQLRIPKGVEVVVPVHAMHQIDEYWHEPQAFLPDRFLDGKLASNNYTFLPFGLGPRNCVGARFAEMEFKTVLSSVIRRFRFEIDPSEPELKTSISAVLQLPLNNRLFVRVDRR